MNTIGKRVVIADDELHVLGMLKALMKTMNYAVVGEARNGQEAVDMYRREKPDVLLLDINMPVKDGKDALREIMHEFPDAMVIMLTSVVDMENVESCLELGAANYIRKDTPISEMRKIISETLESG